MSLAESMGVPVEPAPALPSLTVVMPCLNEEHNVTAAATETLQAMDAKGIQGELIIINDGSTDGTRQVVEKLAAENPRIRVLHHDRPAGIGASFMEGAKDSNCDFVTMFPGDNENDPLDALSYFHITDQVDIIVPFIHNIEVRSKFRRIISSLYRTIINISFGTNLNYTNGTVIYNSNIIRNITINANGFLYQAELLIKLIRAGYLHAETPHFLNSRVHGRSQALTLRSLRGVISAYLRLVWEIHIVRRSGMTDVKLHPKTATYRRIHGEG